MKQYYSGYFNYYLGSYLKTYSFRFYTEEMYYIMQRIIKLMATVYKGAMVVKVTTTTKDQEISWDIQDPENLEPIIESTPSEDFGN